MPTLADATIIRRYLTHPEHPFTTITLGRDVPMAKRESCPADGVRLQIILALVGMAGAQQMRVGCCPNCGYVGYIDFPTREWLRHFYAETWDSLRTRAFEEEVRTRQSGPADERDLGKAAFALAMLREGSADRRRYVCEIGAGYGHTLSALRADGFERVVGVEPSAQRARVGMAAYGIELLNGAFEDPAVQAWLRERAPIGTFYSHHALEHTYDPNEVVSLASTLQRNGDLFAVSVPNFLGEPAFVSIFFLPEPNTFTARALEQLFNRNGYEVVLDRSDTYGLNVLCRKAVQPRPRMRVTADFVERAASKFRRALGLDRSAAGRMRLRHGSVYTHSAIGSIDWWIKTRLLGRRKRPIAAISRPAERRYTDPAEAPIEVQFEGPIAMISL